MWHDKLSLCQVLANFWCNNWKQICCRSPVNFFSAYFQMQIFLSFRPPAQTLYTWRKKSNVDEGGGDGNNRNSQYIPLTCFQKLFDVNNTRKSRKYRMMIALAESCIGQVKGFFMLLLLCTMLWLSLAAFYALQSVPFAETMQTRLLR